MVKLFHCLGPLERCLGIAGRVNNRDRMALPARIDADAPRPIVRQMPGQFPIHFHRHLAHQRRYCVAFHELLTRHVEQSVPVVGGKGQLVRRAGDAGKAIAGLGAVIDHARIAFRHRNRDRLDFVRIDAAGQQVFEPGDGGNHIWAERYDRELEDIFDLQDEITTTVASAIEPELAKAERDRSSRKTKGNLDAWDLYQRGMQAIYSDSLEDYYDAQGLFRQAIALEPGLAAPHAGLCRALAMTAYLDTTSERAPAFEEAEAEGRKAVALDRDDVTGYVFLGIALLTHGVTVGHPENAIKTLEQGAAINPNAPYLQSTLGRALVYSGRAADGIKRLVTAMRLSPRDIQLPQFMEVMTTGYFTLGDYEAVLEWSTKAHNASATATYHRVAAMRIAALAALDRSADARSECEALIANYPNIIQAIGIFKYRARRH